MNYEMVLIGLIVVALLVASANLRTKTEVLKDFDKRIKTLEAKQ